MRIPEPFSNQNVVTHVYVCEIIAGWSRARDSHVTILFWAPGPGPAPGMGQPACNNVLDAAYYINFNRNANKSIHIYP